MKRFGDTFRCTRYGESHSHRLKGLCLLAILWLAAQWIAASCFSPIHAQENRDDSVSGHHVAVPEPPDNEPTTGSNEADELGTPLAVPPTFSLAGKITSQFSSSTSAPGFPAKWMGYKLPPGELNLVELSGTVSLRNSANIFSEILFEVHVQPAGECPIHGTNAPDGPPGVGQTLWSDIVKSPTSGLYSAPVNFKLPVGLPISHCLVVGFGGGTAAGPHEVTGTVNLVVTYTSNKAESVQTSPQLLGLDSEFCFGQNWGCQRATTDDSRSFAAVTQISQRSRLHAIWGNISDSTFDGSSSFGPLPSAPWTAINEVYLYPASECSKFPAGRSFNGPGDYLGHIPPSARRLIAAPLSGSGGAEAGSSINNRRPGLTSGVAIYRFFVNLDLSPGECLVALYGMQSTSGAFDNEDQLRAIVTPF